MCKKIVPVWPRISNLFDSAEAQYAKVDTHPNINGEEDNRIDRGAADHIHYIVLVKCGKVIVVAFSLRVAGDIMQYQLFFLGDIHHDPSFLIYVRIG